MQTYVLSCVDGLVTVSAGDCVQIGLELFTVLITVLSQHRSDAIRDTVSECVDVRTVAMIPRSKFICRTI